MAGRILAAILIVFCVALCPAPLWRWQLVPAVVFLALSFLARLSLRRFVRRALLVWAMVGLIALGLMGQPEAGLRAGNLLLKSTLSLWVVTLLVHTTPLPALLRGLRWLRVPRMGTEALAFWGRYHEVLGAEWQRMQLARRARTIHLGRAKHWRILANSLGLLFIRAYERAEQVHRAMLARGYRGED